MIVKPLKFNLWKSLWVSLREAIAIVIFLRKNTAIRRADFMGAIDHLNYESIRMAGLLGARSPAIGR